MWRGKLGGERLGVFAGLGLDARVDGFFGYVEEGEGTETGAWDW